MADFDAVYNKYILPAEGGYVNDPDDKGGETYCGIARKFNPDWKGWTNIDFYKKTKGTIKYNHVFPEMGYLVKDFYRGMWDAGKFGDIKNQNIAALYFDFHVNSGFAAVKAVRELLGLKAGTSFSGVNEAIAKIDASQFYAELMARRMAFYVNIGKGTQEKYLKGWLNRLALFPTPVKSGISFFLFIAILVVVVSTAGRE